MSLDISTVKDMLSRKFKGASIDDVEGINEYTVFREAASHLLRNVDPLETQRLGVVNLFQDVHDYAPWADLKGKKLIDMRPQVGRVPSDNWDQKFAEDFDRDKSFSRKKFSIEFRDGSKIIRFNSRSLTGSIQVDDVVDTDNWTAGTGVSNITKDTVLFAEGASSIRFDVSSGTNLITWGGTAQDLSDHTQKSSFFRWFYLPDASLVSSIKTRVGSSASDYYEITGSVHFGSKRNGWNLYRFDWDGVSDAGTTDEANTDYVRLEITTTGADTDIRIGRLVSRLPHPHEALYYSNCLFRSTAGTFLSTPAADTDIVNIEEEYEPLFLNECAQLIAEDSQTEDEARKFERKLYGPDGDQGLYENYRADKPNEAIRTKTTHYEPFRRTSGR